MRENGMKNGRSIYVVEMIKTVIFALIITLALVLIAALAIKFFSIPTKSIPIINQVIKGVSILVSELVFFKQKNAGFLRGIIMGACYILLSSLIFALFNGSFALNISLLNDVAFSCVAGLIGGVIAVNVKK